MSGRTLTFLDPAKSRLARGPGGLVLEQGGVTTVKLVPRRAYPWSASGQFIALLNDKDETVAMIEDAAQLDDASRRALDDELAERRFLPVIQRIESLVYLRNLYEWVVETDRGPRTFRTSHGWGEEPVRVSANGVVLVTATDGVRYRLAPLDGLSARERALLSTIV